jgi:hypothetical protein
MFSYFSSNKKRKKENKDDDINNRTPPSFTPSWTTSALSNDDSSGALDASEIPQHRVAFSTPGPEPRNNQEQLKRRATPYHNGTAASRVTFQTPAISPYPSATRPVRTSTALPRKATPFRQPYQSTIQDDWNQKRAGMPSLVVKSSFITRDGETNDTPLDPLAWSRQRSEEARLFYANSHNRVRRIRVGPDGQEYNDQEPDPPRIIRRGRVYTGDAYVDGDETDTNTQVMQRIRQLGGMPPVPVPTDSLLYVTDDPSRSIAPNRRVTFQTETVDEAPPDDAGESNQDSSLPSPLFRTCLTQAREALMTLSWTLLIATNLTLAWSVGSGLS